MARVSAAGQVKQPLGGIDLFEPTLILLVSSVMLCRNTTRITVASLFLMVKVKVSTPPPSPENTKFLGQALTINAAQQWTDFVDWRLHTESFC